jgi:hypothetical protein
MRGRAVLLYESIQDGTGAIAGTAANSETGVRKCVTGAWIG